MNDELLLRYSRQINLPQIGYEGQEKLISKRALIVGLGGLGSPSAMYLAAAGVNLLLADFDHVELHNLQRQIAHTTESVGELKTHSAKKTCHAMNPEVQIDTLDEQLNEDNLDAAVQSVDIVLEGSDNFATRFAVNAACAKHRVPLVSGAAIRWDGQISVYRHDRDDSPCYRCLYKEGPELGERCVDTGVLAPITGVVGCVQAVEAIKCLLDIGQTLAGRLLLFDGLSMSWHEVALRKDPACPVCGGKS
jgi:adenylyltransferase/sulfurtransferase